MVLKFQVHAHTQENQPPSWKKTSEVSSEKTDVGGLLGAQGPELQEHGKVQQEENPVLNLIREIENQIAHLRRSNDELQVLFC